MQTSSTWFAVVWRTATCCRPALRYPCFLLLVGLILLIGPGAGQGQPGEGADQDKSTDLKQRWQQLAGDKATWRRADITDPLHLFVFDLVADRVQATNGEISQEQFVGMKPLPSGQSAEAAAPARRRLGDLLRGGNRHGQGAAAPAGKRAETEGHVTAEEEFRKLDADGDGLLSFQEMDEILRAERHKWDANQDGFIDLDEFKDYYKARQEQQKEKAAPAHGGRPRRAARAVDLPANLPPWFEEYDTDGDGQIGLYEWKAAGQPIARFLALDANGDGFLTPDEVLAAHPSPPPAEEKKPGE
jgi:hypothetical protein